MSYTVICGKHPEGQSCYAVCQHVYCLVSCVAYIETSDTNQDIGQILCRDCLKSTAELSIEDVVLVCANCCREKGWIK